MNMEPDSHTAPDDTLEAIVAYLDGDLPPTERRAFEQRLDTDYTLREELDEVRELLAACRHALRHPEPVNGFARLRAEIGREQAAVVELAQPPARKPHWGIRLAAAAVIVLAGGLLLTLGGSPGPGRTAPETAPGDARVVQLLHQQASRIDLWLERGINIGAA
jgi:anti-sigma factor RsiW